MNRYRTRKRTVTKNAPVWKWQHVTPRRKTRRKHTTFDSSRSILFRSRSVLLDSNQAHRCRYARAPQTIAFDEINPRGEINNVMIAKRKIRIYEVGTTRNPSKRKRSAKGWNYSRSRISARPKSKLMINFAGVHVYKSMRVANFESALSNANNAGRLLVFWDDCNYSVLVATFLVNYGTIIRTMEINRVFSLICGTRTISIGKTQTLCTVLIVILVFLQQVYKFSIQRFVPRSNTPSLSLSIPQYSAKWIKFIKI